MTVPNVSRENAREYLIVGLANRSSAIAGERGGADYLATLAERVGNDTAAAHIRDANVHLDAAYAAYRAAADAVKAARK